MPASKLGQLLDDRRWQIGRQVPGRRPSPPFCLLDLIGPAGGLEYLVAEAH